MTNTLTVNITVSLYFASNVIAKSCTSLMYTNTKSRTDVHTFTSSHM